jgi:uncharacterized protein YdaU (DUF1376 family)
MSKERSPAYQHYPKDVLSDINYQMMTWTERGIYRHLTDLCWLEGSIPADEKLLARILGLSEEDFKGAWVLVAKCFKNCAISGQLIHPDLERQRQIQAEWREKSAKGGKQSAHKRKTKKGNTAQQGGCELLASKPQPKVNQRSTLQSSVSYIESAVSRPRFAVSNPQSPDKSIPAQQASPGDEGRSSLSSVAKKDEAYESFCKAFEESRGIPYKRGRQGDFAKLAELRKQLRIAGKATPEKWAAAVDNYLATPQGKYTLTDLCERYDIFRNASLDRFNKPVTEESYSGRKVDNFGGPPLDEETIKIIEEDKRRAEEARIAETVTERGK